MKSNKRGYRQHEDVRAQNIPRPEVHSMDDLCLMQDEELIKILDNLCSGREAALKSKFPLEEWEVEISYLRRELGVRRDRRHAHETYNKMLDIEFRTMQAEEKNLPSADLDNSKFMFSV